MSYKDVDFWAKEWERVQDISGHSDSVEFWDSFAPKFRKKAKTGERDEYPEQFYELMNPDEGDTIFDMGSGSGVLSLPFAAKGHKIVCADFSKEMLRVLSEDAEKEGLSDRIETIELDWNEDWSLRELPVCDIALSSRSLIRINPDKAVRDLESVARKSVCLGLWTHGEYAYNQTIARAIGYEKVNHGVFEYVLNMLFAMGRRPTLNYINSPLKPLMFQSREECIEKTKESFPEELSPQQLSKLNEHVKKHLQPFSDHRGYGFILDHSKLACFVMIKWDVLDD